MGSYLLDTNILLRMCDGTASSHFLAGQATAKLLQQEHQVYITSQNLIEFWVVATRPLQVNGLGWNIAKTNFEIEQILAQFPLLEDNRAIFSNWLNIVNTNQIKGKRVHDARLGAVMITHGITHLLTFNPKDFNRITGITIVHPQNII